MGGSVGLIIGFIFGSLYDPFPWPCLTKAGFTNIIRFGPGPNGMLRTLGQYMLGSAATFGCVPILLNGSKTDHSAAASSWPLAPQSEQRAPP